MSLSKTSFKLPPVTTRDNGHTRKVGFELEFSGLDLDSASAVLVRLFGGTLENQSAAKNVLHVPELGDFQIELDWHFLKQMAEQTEQTQQNGDWIDLLADAANLLVPVEIVCPPIPLTGLDVLNPMVIDMREAGAVGTEESFLAAYGVHINTELPDLSAQTLFSYLRAFSLLQWWLVDAHQVDLARKISPYVDLYPESYLETLFSQPSPTLNQIFTDYLEFNASRNRALDMLPLLSHINDDGVRRIVDDPKIQSRPAFHYRLPNCHIDRENWSLCDPWSNWLIVEELAQRRDSLDMLSERFIESSSPLIGVNRNEWVEYIDRWLKNNGLG